MSWFVDYLILLLLIVVSILWVHMMFETWLRWRKTNG